MDNQELIEELLEIYDVVKQVGNYVIAVQINSDDDFDYTIYHNGEELDGGIVENQNTLQITSEIFDQIMEMHGIKKTEENKKWN